MTATAHATIDATAASSGRLSSVASGVLEFVWPTCLTLVFTLGAWVLVPTVVLGWQPVTIISGSMAPAVQPGHIVVVEPFDEQSLGAGDVVTYRDATLDRLVTHRIAAIAEDGTITTRGDANAVDDQDTLTTDRIVGVGRLVVPAAGLPALWLHEGRTDLLTAVLVLTVLATVSAAGAASNGVRTVRQRKSRQSGARGPSRQRTLALGTAVVVVAAALGATAISRAAFVGAQDNTANAFQAGTVTPPTGLTATASCQLILLNLVPKIDLGWQSVPGATYQLQRTDPGGAVHDFTTANTYYSDVSGLAFGSTYTYRVRAIAGTWTSQYSAPVSVVTQKLLC